MIAIRRYYLAQAGMNQGFGEVAAPKPVIDVMLSDRFHWTPQEIDDIPKYRLDEYMMVMNSKEITNQEIGHRREQDVEQEMEKFGHGGHKKKVQL